MRKILIIVLIVILLSALGFMLVQGLKIGNWEIFSVKSIMDNNNNLDQELATLSYLIENDYELAKTNLQRSITELKQQKQNYQDKLIFSTEEEIKAANRTEGYKLDYLWTKIGLYATKNNLELKVTVSKVTDGSTSPEQKYDLYDIKFTVNGEYIPISEFIYAIENDSNLGFKIQDFLLKPYSETNILQATFSIKNVLLEKKSISTVQPSTDTSSYTGQDQTQTQTQAQAQNQNQNQVTQ